MDPIEQRLRNEVIYLHYLWHQGPPPPPPRHHHFTPPQTHILSPFLLPPQPQFQHYPIQVPISINSTPTNRSFRQPLLRVSNPTPFKRNSRNRWWNKKKNDRSFNAEGDGIPTDSGKEWPCNEYPSLDSHKWPESDPKRGSSTQPISEEELARHANLRMQYRVINELRGVFVKEEDDGGGGDDDDEEERNNDDGDGGGGGGGLEESEEYKVLLDVFVKDSVLREYYEKNYENGDFCCFVCGVFGIKKSGKKYKSCLGLLQHTISITKTTKRRTHRAFGMVICKVIGWNFGRLPTVIVKGEPLGRSLENSNGVRCDEQQNADGMKEDLKVVEKETVDVGNVESVEGTIVVEDDDHRADVVVLQSSVNEGDACTCSGDIDEGDRDMGIDNNEASNGIELNNNVGLQILLDSNGTSSNFDNLNEQTADENVNEVEMPECMGAKISPVHGIEWPCQNINYACSSEGWPILKSPENSSTHVMSAEEKGIFEAYKLQKRVLEACQDFFQFKSGEEDGDNEDVKMEDSDDDDGEGSEDIEEGTDSEECEEFKFFMRIFLENAELKSYYENNDEDGYFCCLVCGGIGKKTWKRFKGYTGLLQHSLTISKTRKRAHRALGRAMCKVFGWDINQFTKYTTNLTLPHGCSVKSIGAEGEPKHVADGSTGASGVVETDTKEGIPVSLINVSNEITPFK